MKRFLVPIVALAALAIPAWWWLTSAGPGTSPDLTLMTVDGKPVALSGLRGRPLLVTFWATTCPGCRRELPHLLELYEELAPQGLQILGIAMDYDPPNLVLAERNARGIPWPIALDIHAQAAQAFGNVRLTPTSILIAPDGRIVFRHSGELDMARLRADIIDLLQAGAGCRQPAVENPSCSG